MKISVQLAIFNLGAWEIVLIVAIVLLLFGATRLPKLARGLGQSISEFRKATQENKDDQLADGSQPPQDKNLESSNKKAS
jgi:sec-independent protein translocase protein TatA